MIKNWKTLRRKVEKWASMSSFGQWMCSMNGDRFVVLTQWNLLLICLKMKVLSRTLRICCHICVLYVEEKKNGSINLPTKYNSLPFFESFYNWVFFFLHCWNPLLSHNVHICRSFLSLPISLSLSLPHQQALALLATPIVSVSFPSRTVTSCCRHW